MDAKHTPGPWKANTYDGGAFVIEGPDGAVLCQRSDWPSRSEESRANGLAMGAAPELLAELKRMVRAYVSLLESGRDRIIMLGGDCDPVDVMEAGNPQLIAAKAVIAKATGPLPPSPNQEQSQ